MTHQKASASRSLEVTGQKGVIGGSLLYEKSGYEVLKKVIKECGIVNEGIIKDWINLKGK